MEAKIIIEFKDSKDSKAIAEAVSPDNKTLPNLYLKTKNIGKKVTTTIRCLNKLSTLIATIDDLLFCISVAEGILLTTKIKGKC